MQQGDGGEVHWPQLSQAAACRLWWGGDMCIGETVKAQSRGQSWEEAVWDWVPRMSAPPGWLTASLQSCSRLRTSFTNTLSPGSAISTDSQLGTYSTCCCDFSECVGHFAPWHSLSSALIWPLLSCSCLVSSFSPSSLVRGSESQDVTDRKWLISCQQGIEIIHCSLKMKEGDLGTDAVGAQKVNID